MKATKRLISALLISVMLLGCLTACGATQGSSTDSEKATNPVVLTFATEMATGTPEVQAAEILSMQVLRVYRRQNCLWPALFLESS